MILGNRYWWINNGRITAIKLFHTLLRFFRIDNNFIGSLTGLKIPNPEKVIDKMGIYSDREMLLPIHRGFVIVKISRLVMKVTEMTGFSLGNHPFGHKPAG